MEKSMKRLEIGDLVKVRTCEYGFFKILEFLPVERNKPKMVKVVHSTNKDFNFGLIKTFRISDLNLSE